MWWQWVFVAVFVVFAAAYLGRAAWKTWTAARGACGKGCGCGGSTASPAAKGSVTVISESTLTQRLRQTGHS